MYYIGFTLASNYDRNIILSPFFHHFKYYPLSHYLKTSISEFATHASFGGGGSQITLPVTKSVPHNHTLYDCCKSLIEMSVTFLK